MNSAAMSGVMRASLAKCVKEGDEKSLQCALEEWCDEREAVQAVQWSSADLGAVLETLRGLLEKWSKGGSKRGDQCRLAYLVCGHVCRVAATAGDLDDAALERIGKVTLTCL